MEETVDVVVIGGGLIGLATAHRLLERDPGLSLAIVEKEPRVAKHQSGRNSNVLHSGIYYRPGSLRAALCTRGKRELEAYAERRGVPVRRLGKLVVAVEEAELARLQDLLGRGRANGIEGLEVLDADGIHELEPNVTGLRALRVPGTAVVDFRQIAKCLLEDVRSLGADVRFGARVRSTTPSDGGRVVSTDAGEVSARVVVACAGPQADRVASLLGWRTAHRIVPFRGTYRAIAAEGKDLVHGLVYPVPDPSLPFLGVHFTPQPDGSTWIGPNAVLALSREGRGRASFSARDAFDAVSFPGLWRLAKRHYRSGASEIWEDLSIRAFLESCRRYVPALERRHLGERFSGIRAQLMSRDGRLLDDFVLGEAPGRVVVLNAPSPAATACLAIGETIASRVRHQLEASV